MAPAMALITGGDVMALFISSMTAWVCSMIWVIVNANGQNPPAVLA
jgi:hypothetical protein